MNPKSFSIIAVTFIWWGCANGFAGVFVNGHVEKPSYKPDELIVRFAAKADGKQRSLEEKKQILSFLGVGKIERNFKIVPGLSLVKLTAGMKVENALQQFNRANDVLYAEPVYKVHALATFPNDPRFDELWGMHNTGQSGGTEDADIDAPQAWDISTGSSQIVVAVIDTGVDYTHPDLSANMWINSGEIPGNDTDDDNNGYIDDVYGYDFFNEDGDPMDDHFHGTHCAGTIGAVGNNGVGVTGVCWNVKIMSLKFLDASGYGWSSDAISCIEYSIQMGAKVLSNSWGSGAYSHSLREAIDAAGDAGVLFVAAAGNEETNNDTQPHYPSSYTSANIIAVLSTDKNDIISDFSSYGPNSVDLGAPGSDILSCEPGNDYGYHSGTSMATPHVAGACAVLLSLNPWLEFPDVKDILMQTVDPMWPGLCVSGGRLNLYDAVLAVLPPEEGFIDLDAELYSCSDMMYVEIGDAHLQGAETHDVNVVTDGGDFETLMLVEDANRPGSFSATILISSDSVTVEDGTIQVTHSETITAAYYDANDGTGNPAVVQDTAMVDCQAPAIFNVQLDKIGAKAARISFETDEQTTARIRCGQACGGPYTTVSEDLVSTTNHTIKVSPLASETTYFFVVDANDTVGNHTTDHNNWYCYSFTTIKPVEVNVPGDYETIQAAIDNVWDGDTVIVADGIYTGPGNRDIDFNGSAITVKSQIGPENCIIDCNGEPNEPHRGFYFHNSEGASCILIGFTITSGYGPKVYEEYGFVSQGGGIYCYDSSPTIIDCIVHDNSSDEGGGMYNFKSSPTLNNCTFTGNLAEWGGGVYNRFHSNPTMTDCTFGGNWADLGGGMQNDDNCSPILNDCAFSDNTAFNGGGGIFNLENSNPSLTQCTFRDNSTLDYHGGGICNQASSPKLSMCTFIANSALFFGGAISNDYSSPTITNCAFIANSAGNNGGGISDVVAIWAGDAQSINTNGAGRGWIGNGGEMGSSTGSTTLTNCTFYANTAGNGGGINNFMDSPVISNCILWGDTPQEIYVVFDSFPVVTYSDIQGGWSGPGGNNINVNPLFSDPNGPDNILSTEDDNFRLQYYSACIDAGDNCAVPLDSMDLDNDGNTSEPIPWDFDGRDRIVDGDCNDTEIVDMGAYEFTSAYYGDFDGDCDVEFLDYSIFANFYLTDEFSVDIAPTPAGDGIVDPNDLAILCNNWLYGK